MIPSIPVASSDPASSWSGHGGIAQVVDLHAAEHSWEVCPGTVVHGYGFNGQVPGPVIEAAVGDRLLVQFSNSMDQPSVLVWESWSMTTTPLSTSTPRWVHPGGSQQLECTLTQPGASLYWATSQPDTPHTQGGLYGVLLVRGQAEPVVDEERILVVHQVELKAAHQEEIQLSAAVLGRPGPLLLLVNGMRRASIEMRAGSRERWRILNAAADVRLRLSLPPGPAQTAGRDDGRPSISDLVVPPASTLFVPRLDVQIGPFPESQQVSLDAVLAGDGPARQKHRLLTCQIV